MALRPIVPLPIMAPPPVVAAPRPQVDLTEPIANPRRSGSPSPEPGRIVDLTAEPDDETPDTRERGPAMVSESDGNEIDALANPASGDVLAPANTEASRPTENSGNALPSLEASGAPAPPVTQSGTMFDISQAPASSVPISTSNRSSRRSASLPLGPVSSNIMNRTLPSPKRSHSIAFGEGDENATSTMTFNQAQLRRLGVDNPLRNRSLGRDFASSQSATAAEPSLSSIAEAAPLATASSSQGNRPSSQSAD
jgi:hypothetical protein